MDTRIAHCCICNAEIIVPADAHHGARMCDSCERARDKEGEWKVLFKNGKVVVCDGKGVMVPSLRKTEKDAQD